MRAGSFADGNLIIGTNIDTAGINSGMKQIERTLKHFHVFSAKMLGIGGLLMLGKTAVKAASDLQEVQNIVDVTFGDLADKMEDFASISIEAYGMSEFMAKSIAGSFMAMGKASGIAADDAANMALQLTALAGDMASFYNIQQETARVALSAVYTGETETLKRYGIILTEANLQEYAASIGIKEKVKQMDASTKALLRYKYILEQTQHIQGDFIRTEDNWANQLRVLKERWKQLLITIGNGLITLGAPVLKSLNNIVQALTHFANVVGEILSRLLGIQWQDVTAEMAQLADGTSEAAESEEDLADGIGNATKKAKKMIQPFDELNVLTTKASDGAGGLADELGLAVADFDTAFDVEGGGWDFEVPDISSWYEFGKFLSDTLKGLLDDIDWAGIQQHATTFAHNLADFLNGLIQPDTFASIGHTIAEGLNTAVDFAFEFGSTFDFTNLGKSLAAGVNKFFTDFDFAQFADTIDVWVQGLWDAIKTFFAGDENGEGGLDWPLIRNKLKEFLENLDVETVEIIIGYLLIKKILKANFAAAAAQTLGVAFGKLLGSIMGEIAVRKAMKQSIPLLFGKSWFQRLAAYFRGKFAGTGLVTMEQAGASAGSKFLAGFTTALQGIAAAIAAIIGGTMTGTGAGYTLSYIFGEDTSVYEKYLGLKGVVPLWKDFGKAIADVATDFDLLKGTIKAAFEDSKWGTIMPQLSAGFTKIKNDFTDIGYALSHMSWEEGWADFKAKLSENWDAIKEKLSEKWDEIKTKAGEKWDEIKEHIKLKWDEIKEKVGEKVELLKEKIKEKWDLIKQSISEKVSGVKEDLLLKWEEIKTQVEGKVQDMKDALDLKWQEIKDSAIGLWTDIKDGIKKPIQGILDFIESFVNSIIDGINYIIDKIDGIDFDFTNPLTGDTTHFGGLGISKISHIDLPQLANGAVIPPNREFMAVLGDQTHGTNIEAPLDTIVDAFKMALSENDSATMMNLMAQQVELLSVIADKCGITDRQIFNSVKKSASQYTKMTGQTAF